MCGMVGVFGTHSAKSQALFETLLQMSIVRGKDSTGVSFIRGEDSKILKSTGLPWRLLSSQSYKEVRRPDRKLKCIMGHTRSATTGFITSKNAHPFENDRVILTHNGTVFKGLGIIQFEDFDTDSEAIADALQFFPVSEVWPDVWGPTALVWWDKQDKNLNFLRNNGRELHYAFCDDQKTLVWASEMWMLEDSFELHGIEPTEVEGSGGRKSSFWYPGEDQHVGFFLEDGIVKYSTKRISVVRRQKKKAREAEKESTTERQMSLYGTGGEYLDDLDSEDVDIFDRYKTTEEEFKEEYDGVVCMFCLNSVEHEFKDCVIVDPLTKSVSCRSCSTIAMLNNIPIEGTRGF